MNGKSGIESSISLTVYLKQIRQISLLTRDEEINIAQRIREGDEKALNELVYRNLRFVVSVSKLYRGCGLPLDDLIGEGNIGLIEAAKRFDPDKGVKFVTYAAWWIRQAIVRTLARQSGMVRLPIYQAGILSKIEGEFKRYSQANGKEATLEELSAKIGVTVEDIEAVMRVTHTPWSLDTPINDDSETKYLDLVESDNIPSVEENILKAFLAEEIERNLEDLALCEKKVLKMRFGFEGQPQSLKEISKVMGLSRERIRQIENTAINKLRSRARIKALRDYLDQ